MVDVVALAKLARIAVEPGDREPIANKVAQILEYFDKLSEVDTNSVEPFFHANPEMELRADVPEPAIPVKDLTKNAPDSFENCFRIPKVVGEVEQ